MIPAASRALDDLVRPGRYRRTSVTPSGRRAIGAHG
jgi:hypothetical protein